MADEAALACLLSADAELSQEQIRPPFLVLSHVEAGVADGRIFGPAVVIMKPPRYSIPKLLVLR